MIEEDLTGRTVVFVNPDCLYDKALIGCIGKVLIDENGECLVDFGVHKIGNRVLHNNGDWTRDATCWWVEKSSVSFVKEDAPEPSYSITNLFGGGCVD